MTEAPSLSINRRSGAQKKHSSADKGLIQLISRLAFWFLLLTPAMPKLKISTSVYIYPVEVFLILFILSMLVTARVPGLLFKISAARYLLLFWVILLFSSLINLMFYPDYIGLAKVIKGIIYVPIIYLGAKYGTKTLTRMLYFGVFAEIVNLFYYFIFSFPKYGFAIWNPAALLSGFSNKYIDLSTFSIELIPHQGSHGIWGSYCVLLLALSIYLYGSNRIGLHVALFAIMMSITNVLFTVSRSTLLVLCFYIGLIFLSRQKRLLYKLKIVKLDMVASIFIALMLVGTYLISESTNQHIPLIEKIHYTQSAIEETGGESNINLRIGAWQAGLLGIFSNPIKFFIGCGYNNESIKNLIETSAKRSNLQNYVDLPESLFVMSFEYGGIFAFLMIVLFLFRSISYGFHCQYDHSLKLLSLFIVALLPSNLLSGGSIIADLLYGQLLLVIGVMYSIKQNKVNSRSVEWA